VFLRPIHYHVAGVSTKRRRRPFHLAIRNWPRPLRISIAIVCLAIGIVGIALPILPGWPFFFVALAILTTLSPRLKRRWHRWIKSSSRLRSALRRVRPARRE